MSSEILVDFIEFFAIAWYRASQRDFAAERERSFLDTTSACEKRQPHGPFFNLTDQRETGFRVAREILAAAQRVRGTAFGVRKSGEHGGPFGKPTLTP